MTALVYGTTVNVNENYLLIKIGPGTFLIQITQHDVKCQRWYPRRQESS